MEFQASEHVPEHKAGLWPEVLRRTLVLGHDATVAREIAEEIRAFSQRLGYGEDVEFLVRTVLGEALANAIVHGNYELQSEALLADPDLLEQRKGDPRFQDRRVVLDYEVDAERIRIRIEDEGPGFDPERVADPTDNERHMLSFGRGLHMIRQMADEVHHLGKGNILEIVKYRNPEG